MTLSTEDITIRKFPPVKEGRVVKSAWRLYYYQGNFFFPVFLSKERETQVAFLIKKFINEHRELVERDRASPDYKSWMELVNEAFA